MSGRGRGLLPLSGQPRLGTTIEDRTLLAPPSAAAAIGPAAAAPAAAATIAAAVLGPARQSSAASTDQVTLQRDGLPCRRSTLPLGGTAALAPAHNVRPTSPLTP